MSRSPRNSRWTDGGGRFQKCHIRGGDGSAIFHARDEAKRTEREKIILKGSDSSKVKTRKKKEREKRKREEMGSYEQEMQFDKGQISGAGLSLQQVFDPQLLDQGIFKGICALLLFLSPPDEEIRDLNINPLLLTIQNT